MNRFPRYALAALTALLGIGMLIPAEAQQKKKLTYDQVYKSAEPRLIGSLPRIRGWFDDQHYLEQKTDTQDDKRKLFKVNASTGQETVVLNPDDFESVLPRGFSVLSPTQATSDYAGMLFNRRNDLYHLDTRSKTFRRLTANEDRENNPTFSPNGRKIAYTRNRNLYTYDLDTGLEYQLTRDGSDVVYNGWASWVYYEEILGRGSRYRAFYWSPNSDKLAFLRFDDTPVPEFTLFRADGTHGELEWAHYPKPGDDNPMVSLGIVDVEGGEITWADFDETDDHYIAWVFWTPDAEQVTTQWMNRNQNHLKIYAVDPVSGAKTEIYEEKQAAWVSFLSDLHFFSDGSGFLVRSDKDGWSHLYHYNMDGTLKKRLTQGKWTVRRVQMVDETGNQIYFTADKEASTESHLYRVNLNGRGLKKLTELSGSHRTQISPKGSYFVDTFGNLSTPNRMAIFAANGQLVRELGDSKVAAMDEYDLGQVELFEIPIAGYDLPARWYLPPDFDPNKKYPVVFSVYGGPNSRGVSNAFPFSMSRYFMAQQGIIVLTVDHRGSGHFGKEGVAQMHQKLGQWEIHDWVEAIKWLRKKSFIDPTRIGITGGSYGGYITLMALTAGAGYFTHGISLYPVTDWRLYDTVYTERYMDRPIDNPDGYDAGSAMTHLDKMKGKLLLVHGTIDDNVHMQNTMQLVDELTKKEIQFEFMLYPNERHGVRHSGRRQHLNKLVYDFWQKHFVRNGSPDAVASSE